MPKGPKGERRDADTIKNAVRVMKIATGEESEDVGKAPGRAEGGKIGGRARADSLTKQERQDIARKAAESRWRKRSQPD